MHSLHFMTVLNQINLSLYIPLMSKMDTNMGIVLFDWKAGRILKKTVTKLLPIIYLFDGYLTTFKSYRQFKAVFHLRNTRVFESKGIHLLTEMLSHQTPKNFR